MDVYLCCINYIAGMFGGGKFNELIQMSHACAVLYVAGFAKTVLNGAFSISRNTVLKY